MTLPWTGSLDSPYHLDYAYKVYQGDLPEAFDHQYQHPDAGSAGGDVHPQFAAAHPPGFYVLAAPLIGSQLDDGHYARAVAFGRALNLAIGASILPVLAWVGWMLGGRFRERMAIALPPAIGLLPTFVSHAGDIYNDMAVTSASIASMAMSIAVLKYGLSWRRVLGLAALAGAGMSFKATYSMTLLIVIAAVVLAGLLHHRRNVWTFLRSVVPAVLAVVAFPAMLVGWFYYRNWRNSGSWYQSGDFGNIQGRTIKTFSDVLHDSEFWSIVPVRSLGTQTQQLGPITNREASAILVVGSLIVALVALIRWTTGGGGRRHRSGTAVACVVLLVGHVGLFYAAQLRHAVPTGQYSIRYFLPAILSVGLLIVVALVRLGHFAWVGAAAVLWVEIASLAGTRMQYVGRRWPHLTDGQSFVEQIRSVAKENGVPASAPLICLGLAGVLALVVAGFVAFASSTDDAVRARATDEAVRCQRVQT